MDVSQVLALVIGIVGLAGVIFTALKYNRDDTSAIVSQQDTILSEMRVLNEELRTTVDRLRSERDALQVQVDRMIQELRDDISG